MCARACVCACMPKKKEGGITPVPGALVDADGEVESKCPPTTTILFELPRLMQTTFLAGVPLTEKTCSSASYPMALHRLARWSAASELPAVPVARVLIVVGLPFNSNEAAPDNSFKTLRYRLSSTLLARFSLMESAHSARAALVAPAAAAAAVLIRGTTERATFLA